jgi:hypothetical protein
LNTAFVDGMAMGKQASPLLVAETGLAGVFVAAGGVATLAGAGIVGVCVGVVAGFAGVVAINVAVVAVVAGFAGVAAVAGVAGVEGVAAAVAAPAADAAGDVEMLDELLAPQPLRRVAKHIN